MWYNLLIACSIDFRKKVPGHCDQTCSITVASHVFQISRNTIYGCLKLKEKTEELNHQVKGTRLRKVDRDRLKNYLTDNPDACLTEIASEFGCLPTTIHFNPKEHHDFIVNRLVDNTQQLEELAIFERIQIYQRDRSCVYDSEQDKTSAAEVLQECLFGKWSKVEEEMLKVGEERLREMSKSNGNDV